MNELRISYKEYLRKLCLLGGVIFGALAFMIYDPSADSPAEYLGYIGVPLGLLMTIWFCSLFSKARKEYITFAEDILTVNGRTIPLQDIKKVRSVTHVLTSWQAWCPGISIELRSGEIVNYISYYGVKEKNIDKFAQKIQRKVRSYAKKEGAKSTAGEIS